MPQKHAHKQHAVDVLQYFMLMLDPPDFNKKFSLIYRC